MRWLAALLAVLPVAASAQGEREVAASAPLDRSVTIYRAPGRGSGALTPGWLGGFAVVTETREVNLPAGTARLRFEGVTDGIIAQSAIITGLPGGVIEKNRDDALLSPSALMRAFVGHAVSLQRTDAKTGKVATTPARLVSASDEGVVFATDQGEEALRCSGLPETFRYSGQGDGLSAEPMLSVRTRTPRAVRARVRLTYITENVDWNASYIAHLAPDGRSLELEAWITLANGNGVTLRDARTQIVAGRLNRSSVARFMGGQPRVVAQCWPAQTTSDIPEREGRPYELVHPLLEGDMQARDLAFSANRVPAPVVMLAAPAAPPPPPPPPPPVAEQLGDLKLYSLPERTTIAARQMKQTRLLDQREVPVEPYYRAQVYLSPWAQAMDAQPATLMLRMVNDKAHHLGLPLPSGAVLVQQEQGKQMMVLGEAPLADTAEGEKLDLAVGLAPDITWQWRAALSPGRKGGGSITLTVSNAAPHEAAIDLRLTSLAGWRIDHPGEGLAKVNGVPTLKLTLAAGERRQIALELMPR